MPRRPRGLGDVEVALRQDFVDPLPLYRLDRGRPSADRHFCITDARAERALDIISIRRLGEIRGGAELDRFNGGRDAGIPGQNDDDERRIVRVQRLDARQARRLRKLEVDHCIGRRACRQQRIDFGGPGRDHHLVVAALKRALEGAGRTPRRPRRSAARACQASALPRLIAASGNRRVTCAPMPSPAPAPFRATSVPPSLRATLPTRNRPRPRPSSVLLLL